MTRQSFWSNWVARPVAIAALSGAMSCGGSESPKEAEGPAAPHRRDLSAEQIAQASVKWATAAVSTDETLSWRVSSRSTRIAPFASVRPAAAGS